MILVIGCNPLSAKITEPVFNLSLIVWLFATFNTPPKSILKLSPIVKPLAGTLNVPTPPPIRVDSLVVPLTVVLFPVCAYKPYTVLTNCGTKPTTFVDGFITIAESVNIPFGIFGNVKSPFI